MTRTAAAVCSIWGLLAASIAVNGQTQAGSPVLADDFYAGLRASPAIRRDFFLDGHLNKILSGRGRVVSVDATGRYKRRYRIVLEGPFVSPKITFYLFADGDDYRSLLWRAISSSSRGSLWCIRRWIHAGRPIFSMW